MDKDAYKIKKIHPEVTYNNILMNKYNQSNENSKI